MTEPAVGERSGGRDAAVWAGAAAVLMLVAILGGFFIAPEDREGEIQRLLYLHVPLAVMSLGAFLVACVAGILYLRRREDRYDEVVTVSIAIGLLFVVLTIISGSIWARGFWGTWWRWEDPRLVTYLIIALIYGAFFVLRSSTDESRRARFSAVYSIVAFAAVPVSFYAVRAARDTVHPVALNADGLQIDRGIFVWLLVSQVAVIVLFVALLKLELLQRRTDRNLRRLRVLLEDGA
jgi:heme exporter protein C